MIGRNDDQDNDAGTFTPVADAPTLDAALAAAGPTVLFLDDPFCPISRATRREVRRAAVPVHVVDVARQPALSRAVEERTGVRHESPQVIVLAGGRPVWSASHFDITAAAVARAAGMAASLADVPGTPIPPGNPAIPA